MKQKLLLALSALAMAFIVQPRAEALSFTTFTDRSEFESVVGAGSLLRQDFNGFTSDINLREGSLTIGDFTLAGNGNRTYIDTPNFRQPDKVVDGTTVATVYATESSSSSLSFFDGIGSFGADFADFSENRDTRFKFSDGTTLSPILDASGSGFFGFIADSQISSFGFQAFGINDGIGIDNIAYSAFTLEGDGEPTAVPTPAPLLGVIGMGIAAIRKRKQAVAG